VMDLDPARGLKLKIELHHSELPAQYHAGYILTQLRELAEARGYDLCDEPCTGCPGPLQPD
jgi:hypothetical protein